MAVDRRIITGNAPLCGELVRLLGLPKLTRKFVIEVEVGQIVTITAEFVPEVPDDLPAQLEPITKRYELVERDG